MEVENTLVDTSLDQSNVSMVDCMVQSKEGLHLLQEENMILEFLFFRLSSFRGEEFSPNRFDKSSEIFSVHLLQFALEGISNLLSVIWDTLNLDNCSDDPGPKALMRRSRRVKYSGFSPWAPLIPVIDLCHNNVDLEVRVAPGLLGLDPS
jgi:hypothetical protein